MFDNRVTRSYPGFTDATDNGIFSDVYALDRTSKLAEYLNGFYDYAGPATASTSGGWTVTGTGSVALIAGQGGLLTVNSLASSFQSLQKSPTAFQLIAGVRNWGRQIIQIDSLLGNTLFGLLNVTATPFTGASQTDGIWFTTDVTTGEVKGNVAVAGAIQTVDLGVQIIAGKLATFSWYYDGGLYAVPNGRVIFEVTNTILNVGVTAAARRGIALTTPPTGVVPLTPTLAVNASTAVARTLTCDLFYISSDQTAINATPPF